MTRTRHCEEPFDAACGGAQDKLPLRGSDEDAQAAMSPGHGCGLRGRPRLRIQRASDPELDGFASLAMTGRRSE